MAFVLANTSQARSGPPSMIVPAQYKAVIATLLVLILPACAQQPWASLSAISANPSSAVEERPFSRQHDRVAALTDFPLDAGETSITGSVQGNEPVQDKRAKQQASCNRRQAVSVGMTREQLYRSCWGRPTSISTSAIGPAKYDLLLYQGHDYVFLEDDVVISVQVSSR